jgi:hypothetical protein
MSISEEVQRRNAFAACSAFRIEGLEASLDRASYAGIWVTTFD